MNEGRRGATLSSFLFLLLSLILRERSIVILPEGIYSDNRSMLMSSMLLTPKLKGDYHGKTNDNIS